ncbi:MAG: hypothetical protein C5B44_05630 [Acidobacteria bacterium]|nr:MAG: hypothetical protein C5B44_05630 [Acidobacteriota bacterium]
MRLRIKNWKVYQHYTNRCPPWIKLHFSLLTSRDWITASDSERVLAIACMLVASRDGAGDGSFDADPTYFQRVAYLYSTPDFTPLVSSGFLEPIADASASKRMQANATTETEERREEGEAKTAPPVESKKSEPNDGTSVELGKNFWFELGLSSVGLVPMTEEALRADAKKHGITVKESYDLMLAQATKDKAKGEKVDRWYVQDAKWRGKMEEKPKARPVNPAETRELQYHGIYNRTAVDTDFLPGGPLYEYDQQRRARLGVK